MPGHRQARKLPALPGNHPVNDLARTSDPEACAHVKADLAVRADVLPEERGQPAPVGRPEHPGPLLLGEGVLKHEGVDVFSELLGRRRLMAFSGVSWSGQVWQAEELGAIPVLDPLLEVACAHVEQPVSQPVPGQLV
jgi:hypothetical protein